MQRVKILAELVAKYRKENPRSRAKRIYKISPNGPKARGALCLLCGHVIAKWSGLFPITTSAERAIISHEDLHIALKVIRENPKS